METWGLARQQVPDFTLYCGTLGTAFLLFKAYQVTKNTNDLAVCSQIVKDCDSASRHSRFALDPPKVLSFLCYMHYGLFMVSNDDISSKWTSFG